MKNTFKELGWEAFIGAMLFAILVYLLAGCTPADDKAFEIETVSFEYVITEIDSKGFYGDSLTDDTGIFFTGENVRTGTEINIGDTVEAVFEANNLGDGIIEVVKK